MKRIVSKSLCWVLVCVMVFAQLLVPGQAATATQTIYVNLTDSGWSKVNVYAWNDDGPCTGQWPGSAMDQYVGNVYSFDVPTDAEKIIFNDGTNQTSDLVIPADAKKQYNIATKTWSIASAACNHNWIDGCCKICGTACGHKWSNGTCVVCGLACGHRNWVDGACVDCKLTCSHKYQNGVCTVCGLTNLDSPTYYLVGYINGANCGYEDDYENMGTYRFENGKLTATFTQNSYVLVKTANNAKWFMTHGYTEAKAAVLYNTETGVNEKMFVPGNVEVTFTLTENQDGSLTLRYQADVPECEHTYRSQVLSAATCSSYALYRMTCTACGKYYDVDAQQLCKQWLYAVPIGLKSNDFENKTVYRYRDQANGTWSRYSTKQVVYVESWPAGFDTENELYDVYNNAYQKVAPFENSAAKQVIDSDEIGGYLYYHWCYEGYPYSNAEHSGSFNRFHAYFSNQAPADADKIDSGDNSYRFDDSTACDDCLWYFAVPVYSQVSSTYTANFGWGDWSDWSAAKATASATRQVQSAIMYRQKGAALAAHTYTNGVCTACGAKASDENVSTDTAYYLVGSINGADLGCNDDYENMGPYKFVNGVLTAKFDADSYVFIKTEGNGKWLLADKYCTDITCTFSEGKTEKMFVPGNVQITFTLVENEDGSVTVSYAQADNDCEHDYVAQSNEHVCEQPYITTHTCILCGHSYTEQGGIWPHNYVNGTCTICKKADPGYSVPDATVYLVGYINGANYGCEEDADNMGTYKFVNGKLVATFTQDSYVFLKTKGNAAWYMAYTYSPGPRCNFYNTATNPVGEKMLVPGNVEITFYLSEGSIGSYDLSYTTPAMVCPHEAHDQDGICLACGQQLVHHFVDGVCACGKKEVVAPEVEYFLFGYINGANYGCEEDSDNMGKYQFVDGKVVATFTQDSYVGVKTTGNADWFMTNGYAGEYGAARLYNTKTLGNPDKLYVPGGVEVTFTLEVNWDKTLTLSYTTKENGDVVVPTLTLKAPTLEFKDMICVVAFYTAENTGDVVEMGMITYTKKVDTVSIETADCVISGAQYDEGSGRYFSSSQGIHAKYLGDEVYLAVYAQLTDGTYAYSKLASYSAVQYATNQLKNSADMKLKQLVAAMLNYGAQAQMYFGYQAYAPANGSLTAVQKALPESYREDMAQGVPAVSATKQGSFANNQGFAVRKPAISFEGAFCINYFFTPKYVPSGAITLYYWSAEDYDTAQILTIGNATGSVKMSGSGNGEYRADITGISAKDISKAIYVAAIYETGDTTWTSGVLGYSIGAYCGSQASKGEAVASLAMATAVYGYHAKQYFGS